jgi:hypothetical protein
VIMFFLHTVHIRLEMSFFVCESQDAMILSFWYCC